MADGFAPAPISTGVAPMAPVFVDRSTFDPIELLPERAAERLRLLRQRAADAHALVPDFAEARDLGVELNAAEARLRQLTGHPQEFGHRLPENDLRVQVQQRTVNKLKADMGRLQERSERRVQAWRAVSAALGAVEDWLRHGRPQGTKLESADEIEAKPAKGESLTAAIERLRRRCRELAADAHRIRSAPFPSTYAKQQMREQIEALAQAPNVSMLIEHDGKIAWPTTNLQSQIFNAQPAIGFAEAVDSLGVLIWLHRDAVVAALDRDIDDQSDNAAALTHEARQRQEAELAIDLLATERDESFFVWLGQEQRLPVEHRADISPLALLGLKLITLARPTALPPTSTGLAVDFIGPG
jgi:hypothetical protein